jgi:hypothetical protein
MPSSPPVEEADLKFQEQASLMLDEIEHIADDYRTSKRGH